MNMSSFLKGAAAACSILFTSLSVNAQDPRLANRAIANFLASQGMIYIPTSWQPLIQPGSLIVVQWHRNLGGHGVWVLDGALPYMVAEDRPKAPVSGEVASGLSQAFQNRKIDVNVVLGGLAPGVALGQDTSVDYPQTTFENQTYDPVGIRNLLAKSPVTQESLASVTAQQDGITLYQYGYQAFVVTQVFGASNIDIKTTSNTELTLRSSSGKDPAGCSTKTDAPTDKTKVQADATTGTLKTNAKVLAAASTALSKALSIPPATLTLCNKGGGVYKLSRTPAVPLGMTVVEIAFDGNTPKVVPTNGKDLRQAIQAQFAK